MKVRLRSAARFAMVFAAAVIVSIGIVKANPQQIGAFSQLLFGQYNASGVTLTDGQTASVQMDTAGNAKTTTASTSGASQNLASAVAASANQAFTSTTFGVPKRMTLCMSASAATTFTVTTSIDGTTFYGGTIEGATTSANYVPSGAGTLCETVAPAAYVKVATSAANTVTIQAIVSY